MRLVLLQVAGHPGEVLPDRHVEALDLALGDEPRVVLGVVLRRLGGIEAEPPEQVRADEVLVRHAAGLHERVEVRVQVPAPVLQGEDPGEVVHARRQGAHLAHGQVEVPRQRVDGPVHGVAQADDRHADRLVHRPDEHAHRVRVVEQHRVRADVRDVGRDAQRHRDRAQAAQHAAHVDRVVDRVPEAVPGRDVEVELRGPGAADLDRVDDEVGAGERLAPVEAAGDPGGGPSAPAVQAAIRSAVRSRSASMSWRTRSTSRSSG